MTLLVCQLPKFFFFFLNFYLFIYFLFFSEFFHTFKWNGLEFTCLPHPDPKSFIFTTLDLSPESEVAQSCPTLCDSDPVNCSLPGSSIHGIFQARVLQWVAISFSRRIFPTQGLNLGLPHCVGRRFYRLSHQVPFPWTFPKLQTPKLIQLPIQLFPVGFTKSSQN